MAELRKETSFASLNAFLEEESSDDAKTFEECVLCWKQRAIVVRGEQLPEFHDLMLLDIRLLCTNWGYHSFPPPPHCKSLALPGMSSKSSTRIVISILKLLFWYNDPLTVEGSTYSAKIRLCRPWSQATAWSLQLGLHAKPQWLQVLTSLERKCHITSCRVALQFCNKGQHPSFSDALAKRRPEEPCTAWIELGSQELPNILPHRRGTTSAPCKALLGAWKNA